MLSAWIILSLSLNVKTSICGFVDAMHRMCFAQWCPVSGCDAVNSQKGWRVLRSHVQSGRRFPRTVMGSFSTWQAGLLQDHLATSTAPPVLLTSFSPVRSCDTSTGCCAITFTWRSSKIYWSEHSLVTWRWLQECWPRLPQSALLPLSSELCKKPDFVFDELYQVIDGLLTRTCNHTTP